MFEWGYLGELSSIIKKCLGDALRSNPRNHDNQCKTLKAVVGWMLVKGLGGVVVGGRERA